MMSRTAVVLCGLMFLSVMFLTGGCDTSMGSSKSSTARGRIKDSVDKLAAEIDPDRSYTSKEIFSLMEQTLNENKDIFGSAWAIPKDQGRKADIYYIYRNEQTYVTRTDRDMDTDSPLLAWFRAPYRMGRGGWSRPYSVKDNFDNKLDLVTYCALVRQPKSVPRSIIACDYLIRKINVNNDSVKIDSSKKK